MSQNRPTYYKQQKIRLFLTSAFYILIFFLFSNNKVFPCQVPWKAEISPVTFNHNIASTLTILFLTQKFTYKKYRNVKVVSLMITIKLKDTSRLQAYHRSPTTMINRVEISILTWCFIAHLQEIIPNNSIKR